MKLDIKSVLIGALLGINIMLVMGFNSTASDIGYYTAVMRNDSGRIYIIDTTNGRIVDEISYQELKKMFP